MTKIIQTLAGMKSCLSFVIHVLGMIALYGMSLRGVDTSTAIVLVVASYGGTQTAKQISSHINSSKDPNCDTAAVISQMNEK